MVAMKNLDYMLTTGDGIPATPSAITRTVPPSSFPSKSQTFVISAVGTTAQKIVSDTMAQPASALRRLPAFHELPKIYR